MLLIVVGRQPVVFSCHERLEITPCAAGQLLKERNLIYVQRGRAPGERPADPPYDGRCGKPEQQQRRGGGERDRSCQRQAKRRDSGDGRSRPHGATGS